jgi:hypothetical protein
MRSQHRHLLLVALISTALSGCASVEAVNILMGPHRSLTTHMRGVLGAHPGRHQRHGLLLVQPEVGVDYKMITIEPDPAHSYSILLIDAETKKPHSASHHAFMPPEPQINRLLDPLGTKR